MISYMMVILAFLARMISYQKLWYCVWYHSQCCDIMYDITKTIIKSLSCAIFMADIIYISYVIAYDISITRYHTCYCVWYMPLISVLRDIIAIRYHIFYDISAYVMVPVRRDGTGSSWGARRQALLRPRHYQSTGDSSLSLTTQVSTSWSQ